MIGVSIIIKIFFPQFVKCCPRSSISGNILRTSGQQFSMMTWTPVTICIMIQWQARYAQLRATFSTESYLHSGSHNLY